MVRISVESVRVGGDGWRICFRQGRDRYKEVLGGRRDCGDSRRHGLLCLNEPVVKADVLGSGLVDGNGEEGLAGERGINRTAILIFNIEDLVVGVGNRG